MEIRDERTPYDDADTVPDEQLETEAKEHAAQILDAKDRVYNEPDPVKVDPSDLPMEPQTSQVSPPAPSLNATSPID
jgi:hypothetical protein